MGAYSNAQNPAEPVGGVNAYTAERGCGDLGLGYGHGRHVRDNGGNANNGEITTIFFLYMVTDDTSATTGKTVAFSYGFYFLYRSFAKAA